MKMSCRLRDRTEWDVRASTLARNTFNPIRDIIETLRIKPNPDIPYIALSVGDPTAFGNLQPSENIIDTVCEMARLNETRSYGPTIGHWEARQAVAEYSAHQGPVTADDVILCSGCSHAIDITLSVIADAGQNVLIPRPGYLIHKTLGEGLGIVIKYYDLLPDEDWQIDLVSLESQIDENTAAIIVNNPSNPCGSVYTKKHLKDIIEVALRNRVPIIADEIYEHFVFSKHEFTSLSSLSKDVPVITCSGVTKRFLIPGWRLGWIIIHDRNNILGKEVRKGLFSMSTRILGPNTLLQRALPRILKETPQSFFDDTMRFIESQAHLAYQELQKSPALRPIMPQGSMYMMIQIKMSLFPKFENELQFISQLCNEQSVLCIPGKCFNYPNYMRIVLTVPEDILREACNRITKFCEQHMMKEKLKMADNDVVSILNEKSSEVSSKQQMLKNIS
ncbi:tyrosine aminotransferase [Spodoptera frugiperda]|uniref:Tyrosine aminotransferase n=1 Tax=Spodoptera frugiperda TaxID=7108 RepID=A0A9R0EMW6_SPOFR|nr:tyrosine aminotransferase [Spodoptera frugiperda]